MIMNILHEEIYEGKFLHYDLFALILWFIMLTIHIPHKILEKSIFVDTNVSCCNTEEEDHSF